VSAEHHGSPPIIDPALLQILDSEVSLQLSIINEWLEGSIVPECAGYDQKLFNAFHVINSALSISDVMNMASILASAENLIQRGIAHGFIANVETIACFSQIADAIQATLDDLKQGVAPGDYHALELWVIEKRDELAGLSGSLPASFDLDEGSVEQSTSEKIQIDGYELSIDELERLTDPNSASEASSAVTRPDTPPAPCPAVSETELSPCGADQPSLAEIERQPSFEANNINAQLLSQLVNFCGDVAIYCAVIEEKLGELKANLAEVNKHVSQLIENPISLDAETEAETETRINSINSNPDTP
jgi:chemotaxis protein histidine kinase CheA